MMTLYDKRHHARNTKLPSPEIDSFALSLSEGDLRSFIRGCDSLARGREDSAYIQFKKTVRSYPECWDAWFMTGIIDLANGRAELARQAFLRILSLDKPYYGLWIIRFLPKFRPLANLYDEFTFHVMPCTPDIAAILARLYLIENKVREAKKIIHPAFREFFTSPSVQAVWAQTMIMDGASHVVIEELDRRIPYHRSATDTDLLVWYQIGKAFFESGDFRSGICHWEGLLHHAAGKNPRLIDHFRVVLAKTYEKKGFIGDSIEILSQVSDMFTPYEADVSVEFKRGELIEKVNAFRRQGIVRPLFCREAHEYKKRTSTPGFLEFDTPGGECG